MKGKPSVEPGPNDTPERWPAYRKKTLIRALLVRSWDDVPKTPWFRGNEVFFQVQTREGWLDARLPYPYFIATDGTSFWPVAPDFMEANYDRV